MIDPLPAAVTAVMHGDAARIPLVVAAGALTSLGPCVAPRYVALATILGGPRRALAIAAFVAGIVTIYAALGLGAGVLASVTQNAGALDALLALVLAGAGAFTLLRSPHCDRDAHADGAHADAARTRVQPRRLSGIFALGAASALVVSPCCTPIVAAVAAFPALDVSPSARALLLAAFALGHAAPIVVLGAAGAAVSRRLTRWSSGPAPAIVSGTLMIALGGYYGLLV